MTKAANNRRFYTRGIPVIPSPYSRRSNFIPTRFFSISKIWLIDSKNGYSLDRTQEIADTVGKDRNAIDEYFSEKKESIISSHKQDSNAASSSGIKVAELRKWLQTKNEMLEELESQKSDVKELVDLTPGPNSPVADNPQDDPDKEGQKTSLKQDSSDVRSEETPTDFWNDL